MSAALLSLGERAAQGLGRGELSQVYIEGESGTVFLVSADDEAVLVAVAAPGAKVGMMLYEVRRAAADIAEALRADRSEEPSVDHFVEPVAAPVMDMPAPEPVVVPEQLDAAPAPSYAAPAANGSADGWSSYAPGGTVLPGESGGWS